MKQPSTGILQNQIIPSGRALMGRPGFFFEPDDGSGGSPGAPGQGNPNPPGSGDFNAGGNQQQQQQQQDGPPDPFAGIDLNLLDDASRQAIEKARGEITRLHGHAKQSSAFQSERDRLIAHSQRLEQALHSMQKTGQSQQQQQQQKEPTMEEEFIEEMISQGLTPQQAQAAAKVQTAVFSRFEKRFEQKIGHRLAPVVGQVFDQQAQGAFESAKANDYSGAMDIPEIQEAVWQNITQLAQQGKMVTPEVADNLVAIYYHRYLRETGGQPNVRQQSQNQQPPNNGNMTTRFTFPGAGIHARPPQQQQKGDAVSSDEAAAMAATTAMWPVQPKDYKGAGTNNGVYVTRNGQRTASR